MSSEKKESISEPSPSTQKPETEAVSLPATENTETNTSETTSISPEQISEAEETEQVSPPSDNTEQAEIQPTIPEEQKLFETADIQAVWEVCIAHFKSEPSLYAILTGATYTVEHNKILITLVSQSLLNTFNQDIAPILEEKIWFHLKSKNIRVAAVASQEPEKEEKKPITAEERYAHLLTINKNIQKLRDTFNLDIE